MKKEISDFNCTEDRDLARGHSQNDFIQMFLTNEAHVQIQACKELEFIPMKLRDKIIIYQDERKFEEALDELPFDKLKVGVNLE